jgi:hypothetical protein
LVWPENDHVLEVEYTLEKYCKNLEVLKFSKKTSVNLGILGPNFKNSKKLSWEHFLELEKHPKPKFQPSCFLFAENEFAIFDILRIFFGGFFQEISEIPKFNYFQIQSLFQNYNISKIKLSSCSGR